MPNAAGSITREIATLRRTLKAVDRSLSQIGPKLRKAISAREFPVAEHVPRKLNLSPKRQAQLKVQARYMVSIRQLGPKQKAEVREVLQKKGMPAAILRARRLIKHDKAA